MTSTEGSLRRIVHGAGLMAAGANVIMQLARPGVGYGVVESRVESGRLFDHPVKRTRTTLSYLAVAMLGSPEDKAAYRAAVNVAHRQVRSTPDSPVRYHAMDPRLQLWVAACLYRGFEDVYAALGYTLEPDEAEEIYRRSHALGTTLQVQESMWPPDREAFQRYWDAELAEVHIDDTVREHLLAVTQFTYLPRPFRALFGRYNTFVTTGFLPPEFREQMRLPWDERRQRRFDRLMRTVGTLSKWQPAMVREFPYNYLLWDVRRRIRRGRALV
ncbi:oxygenase MpaB family protein [Cryptosporangium minutisporangium]|uniref:Oxygenase MpaB family protein n=2 Tax=Cryptosporangium minutisporangium TaxID=113569 RepID=A0ABP6T4B6_9ACTN